MISYKIDKLIISNIFNKSHITSHIFYFLFKRELEVYTESVLTL